MIMNILLTMIALGYGAGPLHPNLLESGDLQGNARHVKPPIHGRITRERVDSGLAATGVSIQSVKSAQSKPEDSPFRVTSLVLESRLIRRVQPVYPEEIKDTGQSARFALNVVVNGKGEVTEATVIKGHPFFNKAAIDAVKQWTFSPTVYKGEALSIVSLLILDFRWPEPSPELRVRFDADGSFRDLNGRSVTKDMLQGNDVTVQIPPDEPLPLVTMEAVLRELKNQGIGKFRLLSPAYRFTTGRLFYETVPESMDFPRPSQLPSGGISLFPAGTRGFGLGIDQDVKPATLRIDMERLTGIAKASAVRYPATPFAAPLRYRVCVNESGEVVAVEKEYESTPEIPEIIAVLKKTVVTAPGRRLGKAVPTAVPVTIPLR